MKNPLRKFSWFQKVVICYLMVAYFLNALSRSSYPLYGISSVSFASLLGEILGYALIVYLFMWLYNKVIRPRINVKNQKLKMAWKIIQISIIVYWVIMILYGILNI